MRSRQFPDCREIVLDYAADNTEARALYLSLGFEEAGTTELGTSLARLRVDAGDR